RRGAHRNPRRQRRCLVLRRRTVRRLQAVRHRARNGHGRVRGIPGNQAHRHRRPQLTVTLTASGAPIMVRFTGKSAIVTGAARGIGAAYAQALAAEGAKVVVADRNAELGTAVAEKIVADGGTAVFAEVDVADPESAAALADFTVAEFGGIDHLVN